MSAVAWELLAGDGAARTGILHTPHGAVRTPAFMPVGTRAAVKAVDTRDLEEAGVEIVLSNTYHLMLRPGVDLISDMGGLHEFMAWHGPMLTDSGGFQIFSLDPEIDESGATFKSVYDGGRVHLSPEEAVHIQERLGPDIAMALDVCVALPSPIEKVKAEMQRTLRWAERCLDAHERGDQALFGIVQGGADDELRAESARRTADLGFAGFGIGGLSVGESAEDRNRALWAAVGELPEDKPRYVMGLGDAEGLLDSIARGADMFDCVLPTRVARHGRALTRHGDFNLNRLEFAEDESPIDPECVCRTCSVHSRAYLRHLIRMKELSVHRLLTIHNLHYTLDLVSSAREAIAEGRFASFAEQEKIRRSDGSS